MKFPEPYLIRFIEKEDMQNKLFKTGVCKEGDFYCFFTDEQFNDLKRAIQIKN